MTPFTKIPKFHPPGNPPVIPTLLCRLREFDSCRALPAFLSLGISDDWLELELLRCSPFWWQSSNITAVIMPIADLKGSAAEAVPALSCVRQSSTASSWTALSPSLRRVGSQRMESAAEALGVCPYLMTAFFMSSLASTVPMIVCVASSRVCCADPHARCSEKFD